MASIQCDYKKKHLRSAPAHDRDFQNSVDIFRSLICLHSADLFSGILHKQHPLTVRAAVLIVMAPTTHTGAHGAERSVRIAGDQTHFSIAEICEVFSAWNSGHACFSARGRNVVAHK
jgi:hypothetical protein